LISIPRAGLPSARKRRIKASPRCPLLPVIKTVKWQASERHAEGS
jgi:hypothetical protein